MNLKHLFAATVCILSIGTAGSAQNKPTAATVLATVNGTEITVGHVIALTARLPEQYQAIADVDLFKGVLDQLINQTAIGAGANADSLEMKIMIENETRALLAGDVLKKIGNAATGDAAIQAAFDAKYGDQPFKTEYKASHILVASEEEAKGLLESLAGGADFAELAKEKSTGPSGPGGGDLGWFSSERMVAEFSNAVKELSVEGVSAPIKTQFGWHVIKLFETREVPSATLEDVRGEIEEELRDAALKKSIAKYEADAEIVRNDVTIEPSVIRQTELLD